MTNALNAQVDAFERDYQAGESEAILAYCSMVLEASSYPEGFPHNFRLAYSKASQELIVKYELPDKDIVPPTSEYRYVKTRDVIDEKPRRPADVKDVYADVVAAVALRTIQELFEADQGNHVQVLTFNGVVEAVNPATGQSVRPCLVSARATRERFLESNSEPICKLWVGCLLMNRKQKKIQKRNLRGFRFSTA